MGTSPDITIDSQEGNRTYESPYFRIPTNKYLSSLGVDQKLLEERFSFHNNPEQGIFTRVTRPDEKELFFEVPYIEDELAQELSSADPEKMLVYRTTPDGPACISIPTKAHEALRNQITGVQRFGTDHIGSSRQFSQVEYNGVFGDVLKLDLNGNLAFKATGVVYDGTGNISPYLLEQLVVQPYQDVLYMDFADGTSIRIQTPNLNPESGNAYSRLAAEVLPHS